MTTFSTRALPAVRLDRLPRPAAQRRAPAAVLLAGAVLLGALGVTTSSVTLPDLSAVGLRVAAPALDRAAHAAGRSSDAVAPGRRALADRASCWRQAHRSGSDPSSCAPER